MDLNYHNFCQIPFDATDNILPLANDRRALREIGQTVKQTGNEDLILRNRNLETGSRTQTRPVIVVVITDKRNQMRNQHIIALRRLGSSGCRCRSERLLHRLLLLHGWLLWLLLLQLQSGC